MKNVICVVMILAATTFCAMPLLVIRSGVFDPPAPETRRVPPMEAWMNLWYDLSFEVAVGKISEDAALKKLCKAEGREVREYRKRESPELNAVDAYRPKFRKRVDSIRETLPGR